jgi:hypothetical protein
MATAILGHATLAQAPNVQFYIFSIYRAPSGNFNNFLQKSDGILKLSVSSNSEFIICGDFNINYLADTYRKNQ